MLDRLGNFAAIPDYDANSLPGTLRNGTKLIGLEKATASRSNNVELPGGRELTREVDSAKRLLEIMFVGLTLWTDAHLALDKDKSLAGIIMYREIWPAVPMRLLGVVVVPEMTVQLDPNLVLAMIAK